MEQKGPNIYTRAILVGVAFCVVIFLFGLKLDLMTSLWLIAQSFIAVLAVGYAGPLLKRGILSLCFIASVVTMLWGYYLPGENLLTVWTLSISVVLASVSYALKETPEEKANRLREEEEEERQRKLREKTRELYEEYVYRPAEESPVETLGRVSVVCRYCGQWYPRDMLECPNCGAPCTDENVTPSRMQVSA